ncbi:peroxisomal membrane protein PMP34 [Zerene cesonia]|uniref:peroxisomal membrane protein PMP34 n=1 Tax=Zerene cesonia TaxID=33412 RepID=UPI0018E4E23A|nr:peroxisomal membrane protein PMP34 [Zerene cesonia]
MASSLFGYETLVHALAGATGSVVGMAAFYPLDTLRSRQQVEESNKLQGSVWELVLKLAKEEGLESLYRGLCPVLQSLSVSNFVYFYTFHGLRRSSVSKSSALKDLLFGVVAGSINVLITSPLWVVNMRMKFDKNLYNSLFEGLCDVFNKEGVKGLWSGTLPSLLLVSNPAIQFMIYESIKRNLVAMKRFDTYSAFLTGAIAKAIATTLTYPIQLVQARLRVGKSLKPLYDEVKSNPLVLFRGLEAKIMQTVMTAALMFLIYEKVVRLVLTIMRVKITKK